MPQPQDTSTTDPRIDALVADAERALEQDDTASLLKLCADILALEPAYSKAHMLMARSMMPGLNYLQILTRTHQLLHPATYIEIGVATGKSMQRARAETLALGVDPEPRIKHEIGCRARLYPMTSDDFFERFDLHQELGQQSPDLCFIDGLHLFEQTLRDFVNLERYSSTETVALIHDCYPPTELSAARERAMPYWAGDVWKVIPSLRKFRPDLKVSVVPAMPSGLAVITGLNASSRILEDEFDEIVSWAKQLQYAELAQNREQLLNVVANDWSVIQGLLTD